MNNNAISSKSISLKSKMNLDIKKCMLTVLVMSLVIFLLAPIIYLFVQAFLDKDGVFVGLQNFQEYLASESLLNSLKNTVFVSVISTVISLTLALVYAYALTRTKIKFKGFF
nr:ABC transporter, permease protein [Clostridioides difficile]